MNRRARAHHSHRPSTRSAEPYLKYLKPGALAQLRDSRISARSHRINSLFQIHLHRPCPPPMAPTSGGESQVGMGDVFPSFSGRIFGPRFPQRKKLVAAKAFLCQRTDVAEPESTDSVIDAFGGDAIVAH